MKKRWALQRGRLPKEAEGSSSRSANTLPAACFNGAASRRRRKVRRVRGLPSSHVTLQRGRLPKEAEGAPGTCGSWSVFAVLQRGRLPKEAEGSRRPACCPSTRPASTGPPPEGGGRGIQ